MHGYWWDPPPSHCFTTRLHIFESVTVAMFMIVCPRCDKGPAFALLHQPPVSLLLKVIDVSNPSIKMDDSQNAIHRICWLWCKGGHPFFPLKNSKCVTNLLPWDNISRIPDLSEKSGYKLTLAFNMTNHSLQSQ